MTRTQYYAAHSLIRANWKFGFKMLIERQDVKLMERVFNMRLPSSDKLETRRDMALTFAMYGDHAPIPLINEKFGPVRSISYKAAHA